MDWPTPVFAAVSTSWICSLPAVPAHNIDTTVEGFATSLAAASASPTQLQCVAGCLVGAKPLHVSCIARYVSMLGLAHMPKQHASTPDKMSCLAGCSRQTLACSDKPTWSVLIIDKYISMSTRQSCMFDMASHLANPTSRNINSTLSSKPCACSLHLFILNEC